MSTDQREPCGCLRGPRVITVKPCEHHYYYDGWDGAEEIATWTDGPLPDKGLVLVDAERLARLRERRLYYVVNREVPSWSGGDVPTEGVVLVSAEKLARLVAEHAAFEERIIESVSMENEAVALRAALAKAKADETSLRRRWSDLGTIHRTERAYRQELEIHIAKMEDNVDHLTLDRDRWEQRAMEADKELARMRAAAAMGDEYTPTVLTMSGETGQDGADECECGGKMWCLACQQSAWPSRADDCLAPTPEAS